MDSFICGVIGEWMVLCLYCVCGVLLVSRWVVYVCGMTCEWVGGGYNCQIPYHYFT